MKAAPSLILDMVRGHVNKTKPEDRESYEPDQFDEGLLAVVAYIDEMVRWAWVEAWDISTAPKERGVVHRALTDEQKAEALKQSVYVPGAKYDIAIGDHLSQEALRNAARRLVAADVALEHACVACGPEPGQRPGQKRRIPVVARIENCALAEYSHTLVVIRWRLNYLADRATRLDAVHASAVMTWLARADRHLANVRGKFELAHRHATKNASIDAGPDRFCINNDGRLAARGRKECHACRKKTVRKNAKGNAA